VTGFAIVADLASPGPHLSVNTMGAGLNTVDDHLAALATAAEAAKTISG
jgi:hypothetical protein